MFIDDVTLDRRCNMSSVICKYIQSAQVQPNASKFDRMSPQMNYDSKHAVKMYPGGAFQGIKVEYSAMAVSHPMLP